LELRASPKTQEKLLELAGFDLAIHRGQRSIASLPQKLNISGQEKICEDCKALKHEARIQFEAAQAEMKRADSDVYLVAERIKRDSERLSNTSSAKDAQGLDHEIQSLRKRQSDLEDIQLLVLEKLETAENFYSETESSLKSATEQLEQIQLDLDSQTEALQKEISEQIKRREDLVDGLPRDLLSLYERQRERYGVGASLLVGGVSTASGVTLTESDLNDIRQAPPDAVILCPDSNAILIRESKKEL